MKRKKTAANATQSETRRGELPAPTPRSGSTRLRTLDDVAVELARVYRKAVRGDIPTADASRLTYILASLGKAIEAAEQSKDKQFLDATVIEFNQPSLADFYETVQTISSHPASQPEKEIS